MKPTLSVKPMVDLDFQKAMRQHTEQERASLRKQIIQDGRFLHPIVLWNGFIADGMSRWAIWNELPDDTEVLPPEFVDLPLTMTKADVITWIRSFQVGRRNLQTEELVRYYSGKAYKAGGQTDLSNRQSIRHKHFADAIDRIGEFDPKAKDQILSGAIKLTLDKAQEIARMSPRAIQQQMAALRNGKQEKLAKPPKPPRQRAIESHTATQRHIGQMLAELGEGFDAQPKALEQAIRTITRWLETKS